MNLALRTTAAKPLAGRALFSPSSSTADIATTKSLHSPLAPLKPVRAVGLAGAVIEVGALGVVALPMKLVVDV